MFGAFTKNKVKVYLRALINVPIWRYEIRQSLSHVMRQVRWCYEIYMAEFESRDMTELVSQGCDRLESRDAYATERLQLHRLLSHEEVCSFFCVTISRKARKTSAASSIMTGAVCMFTALAVEELSKSSPLSQGPTINLSVCRHI